jgi:hypothetical protein
VHLNAVDLSRTVVRSTPTALVELAEAGKRVARPTDPNHLVAWKARTLAALHPVMHPYLDLCRVPRWVPDFLTPPTPAADLAAGVEQILATPAATLRAELQPRIDTGDLPSRVANLASGETEALQRLGAAMVAFHKIAVAPYWSDITAAVQADRAARGSTIVNHGIDRVLGTLSPYLRWNLSTLSYECPGGSDLDIEPAGRGVTLVPSYLSAQPSFLDVADAPIVLSYPIQRTQSDLTTRTPLADLLGRTRAAVLGAITTGLSTTEVAHAVGISPGSASHHTAILRSAGLITTHRTGPAVLHSPTPLGTSLMHAARGGQW